MDFAIPMDFAVVRTFGSKSALFVLSASALVWHFLDPCGVKKVGTQVQINSRNSRTEEEHYQ
jgi:hypothetical protein